MKGKGKSAKTAYQPYSQKGEDSLLLKNLKGPQVDQLSLATMTHILSSSS